MDNSIRSRSLNSENCFSYNQGQASSVDSSTVPYIQPEIYNNHLNNSQLSGSPISLYNITSIYNGQLSVSQLLKFLNDCDKNSFYNICLDLPFDGHDEKIKKELNEAGIFFRVEFQESMPSNVSTLVSALVAVKESASYSLGQSTLLDNFLVLLNNNPNNYISGLKNEIEKSLKLSTHSAVNLQFSDASADLQSLAIGSNAQPFAEAGINNRGLESNKQALKKEHVVKYLSKLNGEYRLSAVASRMLDYDDSHFIQFFSLVNSLDDKFKITSMSDNEKNMVSTLRFLHNRALSSTLDKKSSESIDKFTQLLNDPTVKNKIFDNLKNTIERKNDINFKTKEFSLHDVSGTSISVNDGFFSINCNHMDFSLNANGVQGGYSISHTEQDLFDTLSGIFNEHKQLTAGWKRIESNIFPQETLVEYTALFKNRFKTELVLKITAENRVKIPGYDSGQCALLVTRFFDNNDVHCEAIVVEEGDKVTINRHIPKQTINSGNLLDHIYDENPDSNDNYLTQVIITPVRGYKATVKKESNKLIINGMLVNRSNSGKKLWEGDADFMNNLLSGKVVRDGHTTVGSGSQTESKIVTTDFFNPSAVLAEDSLNIIFGYK